MNVLSKKRATLGARILFVAALVSLNGCGGEKEDASADHNKQDVSFVRNMIPHHAQAVEMSKMATTRAQNEQVKALAKRIEAAQQPEIDTMNGWLAKWGKKTIDPSSSNGKHTSHDASMQGMMSADDMNTMEAATGAAFDRLFLEMMVEHHNGAVQMAKTETAKGRDTAAKSLASTIADAQQAEITEMQTLRNTL